jgi:hypothetical protein
LANLDLILERVQLGPEDAFYRVLANTAGSPLSPRQLCTLIKPDVT